MPLIDLYDIEIRFMPVGPEQWGRLTGHHKKTPPVERAQIRLKQPKWMAEQKALMFSDHFRLRVCPQKVLGRWNVTGSPDLREVINETAPLVIEVMGWTVTPHIRANLAAGEYRIREVHIAEQFHLLNHGCTDFLDQVRRKLNDSHLVQRMERGRGFRIDAHSRRCEVAVYNKLFELHRKALPQYNRRIEETDGMARVGLMIDRAFQQHVAALGPRLEFRLGDHFFKPAGEYTSGSAWQPGTAEHIFRRELRALKLPSRVNVVWARRQAEQALPPAVFRTFLLWSHGESAEVAAGSAKTLQRHDSKIKATLGVSIRQPATSVLGRSGSVDPGRVLRWENRVGAELVDLDRDLGSLGEYRIER